MLRSGTAASSRSESVRVGRVRASSTRRGVATALTRPRSLDSSGRAEDDGRVEIHVAADEAARDVGPAARLDHGVEARTFGVGDRHEHRLRLEAPERPADLLEVRDDWDALDAAAPEAGIVVHEADDPGPGPLP